MADVRINALATTATTSASDDFMALDGTTNGTRKMSAATPKFLTSVAVPTVTSAAGANLNLITGTSGVGVVLTSATGAITAASTGSHVFGTTNTVTMAAGDLTATGIIETTISNNAAPLRSTGATTGANTVQMTNTGGVAIFGQENSAGNNLIAGSTAYDTVVRGPSGIAFSANAGTTLHARLTNAGSLTLAGNLTVSGTGSQTIGGVASRLILQGGTADTPASAAAAGTAGSVVWDASYIYVCTATNTWKRAAIATW